MRIKLTCQFYQIPLKSQPALRLVSSRVVLDGFFQPFRVEAERTATRIVGHATVRTDQVDARGFAGIGRAHLVARSGVANRGAVPAALDLTATLLAEWLGRER